jgi:hypothetical protein
MQSLQMRMRKDFGRLENTRREAGGVVCTGGRIVVAVDRCSRVDSARCNAMQPRKQLQQRIQALQL